MMTFLYYFMTFLAGFVFGALAVALAAMANDERNKE